MADFVRVPETDWQAICDSVRAKTGGTELLTSGEVPPLIDGLGGGQEVLYSEAGQIYVEDVVVPEGITTLVTGAYAIYGIKSIFATDVTALGGHYCFGTAWNCVERIIAPKLQAWGGAYWCRGGNLKEVQAGSIGFPVFNMPNAKGFDLNSNTDLVITIYVDAATLAEVPADISDYSPFGATNATIIYRNSTTGEVITA